MEQNNYLAALGDRFSQRGLLSNSSNSSASKVSNKNPFYTTLGPGPKLPLRSGDSEADVLAKMYRFMTFDHEEDKKDDKKDLKLQKEEEKLKEGRNDELVSLFDEKYTPKKKLGKITKHAIVFGVGAGALLFSGDVMAKIKDVENMFGKFGRDLDLEGERVPTEENGVPREVDVSSLLEAISSGESARGAEGYDITFGRGRYDPEWARGRRISDMTMTEVERLQTDMLRDKRNKERTSAAGKYQVIKTTLFGARGTAEKPEKGSVAEILGLKADEKFTPQTQERIGKELLKRRGLEEYKSGKISLEEFQERLAHEWAAIPSPKTGKSVYTGQKAGISQEKIRSAIRKEMEPQTEQKVAERVSKKDVKTAEKENFMKMPINLGTGVKEEKGSINTSQLKIREEEEEEEDISEKVLREKNIPKLMKKNKNGGSLIIVNNTNRVMKQGDTYNNDVSYDESDSDPDYLKQFNARYIR